MKIITQFRGQSGCRVELIEREGGLRVRKTAFEKDVSERLKIQCEKMRRLGFFQSARSPAIYETREDHPIFFYEMEYCERARTLVEAAEEMSLYELRKVADFLITLLGEMEQVPANGVPGKFADLNRIKLGALLKSEAVLNHPDVAACLEQIFSRQDDYFKSVLNMESRFCHGDLTLDNILCDWQGGRWLIDPIDCFFEHAWCDISKLYQDIEGEWFQIRSRINQRRASSNLWRLGSILKEWIREQHPLYSQYHYYFLGLHFARILPYADGGESSLRGVVRDKTKLFLEKFIGGKTL